MYFFNIIAQTENATEVAEAAEAAQTGLVPINEIWTRITSLQLIEALTFTSFGLVCLFYGWRVFKALVIISFTLLGGATGMIISKKIGGENNPLLGILMAIVFGIVSIPLMRWAVGLLGAAAGALLAAGIWYACKLPDAYMWAGAIIGAVAGGMISFIVFKIAVMLFSSLGGSILFVAGSLALLYIFPQTKTQIEAFYFDSQWFLPVTVIVPTVIGLYWQNKFIKSSQDWSL